MPKDSSRTYRFDRFVAEPRTGRLLKDGEVVPIEPKVFEILLHLLENRERLVEKQELFDTVWQDVVVSENALTRAVARLRKILGDDPRKPRFIETAHSRGYRFRAAVEVVESGGPGQGAIPSVAAGETTTREGRTRPSRSLDHRPLAAAILLLVLAGAISWQRFIDHETPGAVDQTLLPADSLDPRRVAALPMVDLSGRDEDAYFVDGLTEQMISTLSRIEGLRIIPRTTVMAYKGTDRRVLEIGRELGAGTVLEGSVRRGGDELRITVQLIDVAREQTLWSGEFDRPLEDVFAIQSEVAVRVAEALQSSIAPSVLRRLERGPTRVIGAWDHYLKGRQFHTRRSRSGLANAAEQYRRALELDPEFALAHAQLAALHALQALTVGTPPGWPEVAVEAAERALELDPETSTAYRALGMIALYQDHIERSLEMNMKALELNPSDAAAVYNGASVAQILGRIDEAVLLQLRHGDFGPYRLMHRAALSIYLLDLGFEQRARELARQVLEEEPLTPYLNLHLARLEMIEGDLAEARERLERLRQAYSDWPNVWAMIGQVEERAGRLDEALASFDRASEIGGRDNPDIEVRLARVHLLLGDRERALEILEGALPYVEPILERGSDSWGLRWQMAAIEAVRGNTGEAVAWLEEAVDLGRYDFLLDGSDPIFEPLRGDPRFQRQLERMQEKVATMRERLIDELGPDLQGVDRVAAPKALSPRG